LGKGKKNKGNGRDWGTNQNEGQTAADAGTQVI
jgi:hypothetical protein